MVPAVRSTESPRPPPRPPLGFEARPGHIKRDARIPVGPRERPCSAPVRPRPFVCAAISIASPRDPAQSPPARSQASAGIPREKPNRPQTAPAGRQVEGQYVTNWLQELQAVQSVESFKGGSIAPKSARSTPTSARRTNAFQSYAQSEEQASKERAEQMLADDRVVRGCIQNLKQKASWAKLDERCNIIVDTRLPRPRRQLRQHHSCGAPPCPQDENKRPSSRQLQNMQKIIGKSQRNLVRHAAVFSDANEQVNGGVEAIAVAIEAKTVESDKGVARQRPPAPANISFGSTLEVAALVAAIPKTPVLVTKEERRRRLAAELVATAAGNHFVSRFQEAKARTPTDTFFQRPHESSVNGGA